jgi:hypothetical protein
MGSISRQLKLAGEDALTEEEKDLLDTATDRLVE